LGVLKGSGPEIAIIEPINDADIVRDSEKQQSRERGNEGDPEGDFSRERSSEPVKKSENDPGDNQQKPDDLEGKTAEEKREKETQEKKKNPPTLPQRIPINVSKRKAKGKDKY